MLFYFQYRSLMRRQATSKYVNRVQSKISVDDRQPEYSYKFDNLEEVFETQHENTVNNDANVNYKFSKRKRKNVKNKVG